MKCIIIIIANIVFIIIRIIDLVISLDIPSNATSNPIESSYSTGKPKTEPN